MTNWIVKPICWLLSVIWIYIFQVRHFIFYHLFVLQEVQEDVWLGFQIAPVTANNSSNSLVQKPAGKYSFWMWQYVCGTSVEIPAPHLEFAARRDQHVQFFPELIQNRMSYDCLIPAIRNRLQFSLTFCLDNVTCRFCRKRRILHSGPKKIKLGLFNVNFSSTMSSTLPSITEIQVPFQILT